MPTKPNIEEVLTDHRLRVTDQRTKVLKIFFAKDKVFNLAHLNKLLGKDFDRITLYRTLNSFEEHGLIHKIPDKTGNPTYALCKHDPISHAHQENHVHFKCIHCDLTMCLKDIEIPAVKLPKKLKASNFNFIVEGFCENCAKLKAKKKHS
jgi:Fur family ferric uptake transcriptional regulator